jgi:hypothetical protein
MGWMIQNLWYLRMNLCKDINWIYKCSDNTQKEFLSGYLSTIENIEDTIDDNNITGLMSKFNIHS